MVSLSFSKYLPRNSLSSYSLKSSIVICHTFLFLQSIYPSLEVNSIRKYTSSLKSEMWEIVEEGDTEPTYALQWKYLNVYYELIGKISEADMELIGEQIMY